MPADRTEPPVTAFMLVKTTPEWLAMTVAERVQAFTTHVVPAIEARTRGVRCGSGERGGKEYARNRCHYVLQHVGPAQIWVDMGRALSVAM
jgi:hypothetical protein